ncbi:MAG: protein-glutamate O-methyltransferase CheR [Magnetococcales bacterium]|nr:protein-glutamate O-methyltransferase CheR [Magnetococcales bacterium]
MKAPALRGPDQGGDERWLQAIIAQVREVTRCDLGGYDREMLLRRIAERVVHANLADLADYLACLQADTDECLQLIKVMTVQVSAFFRNPIVFEVIDQQILPEIIARKKNQGRREIRVWSAGCCSGEEAYSIAILIHNQIERPAEGCACHVFATDIQPDTLESAREGIYPREKLESTKLGLFGRYFIPIGGRFQVSETIRKMVLFSYHDLTSVNHLTPAESVFGTFDLILCRNVLIYFSPGSQADILRRLHDSLADGGYLILGEAEYVHQDLEPLFEAVDRRHRIFRKR